MATNQSRVLYTTNDLLEITWTDGRNPQLVVRSYFGRPYTIEPDGSSLLHLLDYAIEPRTIYEIESYLTGNVGFAEDAAAAAVATAIDTKILLTEAEAATQRTETSQWFEKNWRRGLLFYLFSYGMREKTTRETEAIQSEAATAETLEREQLPEPSSYPGRTLRDVLLERRSHRDFNGSSISLTELARILDRVVSPQTASKETKLADRDIQEFVSSAVDSVGITVVASRVDRLDPGVYRYLPDTHEFGVIRRISDPESADSTVQSIANGQEFGMGAGATFLPSLRYPAYLRQSPDWERAWTGYQILSTVAQRLLLAVTAEGLQTWLTVALEESEADDVVGVDWPRESVQTLISVGHEVTTASPDGQYE